MKTTVQVSSRLSAWMLAAALAVPATALAQTAHVETGTSSGTNGQDSSATTQNGSANGTNATGKAPLQQSNEGFWGHMNPFARKKWVNRQLDPVKDRLNELDELSAKNARDIRDLDSRAQAGIHQAQSTADQANQVATDAGNRANQAQQLADQASTRTNQLGTTVSNLDQYQAVADTEIHFHNGQTVLNAKAKSALDEVASSLQGKQGYIVEVQGYSRAAGSGGIQTSERMADAVVRYLVTDHQIPMYRIHRVALGNAKYENAEGKSVRGSLVHVTLMQNSLATLNAPENGASPIGATQPSSAQPSPQGTASQPSGMNQNQ